MNHFQNERDFALDFDDERVVYHTDVFAVVLVFDFVATRRDDSDFSGQMFDLIPHDSLDDNYSDDNDCPSVHSMDMCSYCPR